jgi:hypothetical protein
MSYNGGPIAPTMNIYVSFWHPGTHYEPAPNNTTTGDGTYEGLITRFLSDLSGSPYMDIMNQYTDMVGSGHHVLGTLGFANNSTHVWDDTADAFPHTGTPTNPLLPGDIDAEISNMEGHFGVSATPSNQFLIFLPKDIWECAGSCGGTPVCETSGTPTGTCIYNPFCAYHAWYSPGTPGVETVWAVFGDGWTTNGCNWGMGPNNDIGADGTLSDVAHEIAETLTNGVSFTTGPYPTAWYETNNSGEIGDKCNWLNGPLGSNNADVTINGHPYLIQEEWSNKDFTFAAYSGCVMESPERGLLTVWRPSNGVWYGLDADDSTILFQIQWGLNGDMPVPARFSGSAKNLAVWRPSNGDWYVRDWLTGTVLFNGFQWGLSGDKPVPADFASLGHAQFAVWRPSNGVWYVRDTNGTVLFTQQWGLNGDVPVPADYDGSLHSQFAVWRPSYGIWYVLETNGTVEFVSQWGLPGDIPVPADFAGLDHAQFAVWRPSNGVWYVKDNNGTILYQTQWGLPGDVPVPGDYLGLGHAQFAVWRPSNGVWYIKDPVTGTVVSVTQWGLNGDNPVAGSVKH